METVVANPLATAPAFPGALGPLLKGLPTLSLEFFGFFEVFKTVLSLLRAADNVNKNFYVLLRRFEDVIEQHYNTDKG